MAHSFPRYSRNEEIANSVTHAIGVGLSVAALAILVTYSGLYGDAWRVVSFSVYGTTLILLYLASTFYHAFRSDRLKQIFRTLDHSAIFLLIAGSYTPFTLVTLRGAWGWTLFGLIWGIAIAGIILTLFRISNSKLLTSSMYIAMGWLVMIAVKPLLDNLSSGGLMWLAVGGASYTFGVVFYVWEKLPFNHAIWHLFVLGGSISHFFCMLFHVLPMKG